ncbi:MAG TPA: FAD-dependent monooxygenase [Burkholderiales bacterium]|nr:FAD-dependent monooxygenase [Burkholderiales bacterium]
MSLETDVLVVGAGPTGLMLANQLHRRGVRVRIIDRHAGPAMQTRALGVQARTLEIYAHLGFADRAIALGKRATGADIWSLGRHAARVPLSTIGLGISPYPYLLILGQDDNERLLGDKLREQGVMVEWNTELTGIAQAPDHARATLKMPDGSTQETTSAWIAGCDGAHSAVRELNRIAFSGAPYEHVFFVADVEMTGSMVPEEVNVYLWRQRFHLFFPMRGENHWRIVGILPRELRDRKDLAFEELSPFIERDAGSSMAFRKCSWLSTYRIHHRRAEQFRVGRCFVLGDAAHIHSPVGAQGMNTGLQDAYNLAWKLALVTSGKAAEALIDSYAEERLPVARRLLETTDRMFSVVVSENPFIALFRTRVLVRIAALVMKLRAAQRLAFRTISQTGIHYRESSLSESLAGLPADAPRAGDRFPWLRLALERDEPVQSLYEKLDDTRFTLILFGQPAPTGGLPKLDGLLDVLGVPSNPANDAELARAHVPPVSFYLLRPDGYIAMAGLKLDTGAVLRYVEGRLHIRP